jgi:hypothetical protein
MPRNAQGFVNAQRNHSSAHKMNFLKRFQMFTLLNNIEMILKFKHIGEIG